MAGMRVLQSDGDLPKATLFTFQNRKSGFFPPEPTCPHT